jgi:hypothetical protein
MTGTEEGTTEPLGGLTSISGCTAASATAVRKTVGDGRGGDPTPRRLAPLSVFRGKRYPGFRR